MNWITKISNVFKRKELGWTTIFELGSGFGGKRSTKSMYYGTVYACIDLIASKVASSKFHLYKVNGKGEKEEIFDHGLLNILKKSNNFQSGSDILYLVSSHIDAYGQSYLWPRLNLRKEPIELWANNPDSIITIKDDYEFIKGYKKRLKNGQELNFEPHELIDIKRPNPFNPYEGISTIQMAKLEIDNDLSSIEYNQGFMANGARPSGVLTTEKRLEAEEADTFARKIKEKYAGKDNAHKVMVLGNGLKYEVVGLSHKDIEFLESRKFSREQVMHIFKIHRSMLGISDGVNYANAKTAEYVFAKYVLKPRLEIIQEKISQSLLPLFKNSAQLIFEFENVVPKDQEALLSEKKESVGRWRTVNEVRAMDNLPPVTGGDQLYQQFNMLPINEVNSPNEHNENKHIKKSLEQNISLLVKQSATSKYLTIRRRYLTQVEKRIRLVVKEALADYIKEIKNHKPEKSQKSVDLIFNELMPDPSNLTKVMGSIIFRYGEEIFDTSFSHSQDYLGFNFDFSLENSGAVAWLKQRSQQTSTDARDSVLNKAREIITQSLQDENFTLDKAQADIVSALEGELDWRALRIARTEAQTAYNQGAKLTYEASGLVQKYKWLSANDSCEICNPNDNQVVDAGSNFPSGHDFAPAHPNCRCEVIPSFD